MTREEALDILTHNWTRLENPNYDESELDKAYYMAIEALSLPRGDLISRADAMTEFREWVKRANENGETPTWNDAVSLIGSLPSADADVVRCKDCDRGFGSPVCPIQSQGWAINTDTFYCAWGERREL